MPDAETGTVLITRPEPGASDTARRVAELGWRPIIASALTIEQTPSHLPPPDRVQAVLVTSGNALAGLPAEFHRHLLLAVGNATAARARAQGFQNVLSANGDGQALQAFTAGHADPRAGALLLATGRGLGYPLVVGLRQLGFKVLRRVLYATVPTRDLPVAARQAMDAAPPHAALFFSAETATQFVKLIQRAELATRLRQTDALAIGQPAAMALRTLPWRRILVATRPTQDDMLALL